MVLPFHSEELDLLQALADERRQMWPEDLDWIAQRFYELTGRAEDETYLLGVLVRLEQGFYSYVIHPFDYPLIEEYTEERQLSSVMG